MPDIPAEACAPGPLKETGGSRPCVLGDVMGRRLASFHGLKLCPRALSAVMCTGTSFYSFRLGQYKSAVCQSSCPTRNARSRTLLSGVVGERPTLSAVGRALTL